MIKFAGRLPHLSEICQIEEAPGQYDGWKMHGVELEYELAVLSGEGHTRFSKISESIRDIVNQRQYERLRRDRDQ